MLAFVIDLHGPTTCLKRFHQSVHDPQGTINTRGIHTHIKPRPHVGTENARTLAVAKSFSMETPCELPHLGMRIKQLVSYLDCCFGLLLCLDQFQSLVA